MVNADKQGIFNSRWGSVAAPLLEVKYLRFLFMHEGRLQHEIDGQIGAMSAVIHIELLWRERAEPKCKATDLPDRSMFQLMTERIKSPAYSAIYEVRHPAQCMRNFSEMLQRMVLT